MVGSNILSRLFCQNPPHSPFIKGGRTFILFPPFGKEAWTGLSEDHGACPPLQCGGDTHQLSSWGRFAFTTKFWPSEEQPHILKSPSVPLYKRGKNFYSSSPSLAKRGQGEIRFAAFKTKDLNKNRIFFPHHWRAPRNQNLKPIDNFEVKMYENSNRDQMKYPDLKLQNH